MAAITVSSLSKNYGEVLANDDLSFTVEEGEVFGYLGPNGAGKTTTIRTLLGFQSPTSGSAELLGHDVRDERDLVRAKRSVGYLPANPAFDGHVTGREILDLHAAVTGDERRGELLDIFDPPLDRKVREYSAGNRQMLGLVQAFMHDPDLVVMDEPTAGLDPLKQQEFNEFVRREKRAGTTVFMSSHVLSEVRRVCDRVGVIRRGRLVTVERVGDLLSRSGKFVRLRAADGVDPDDLALDGVHDLDVHTMEVDGTGRGRGTKAESHAGETPADGPGGETPGESREATGGDGPGVTTGDGPGVTTGDGPGVTTGDGPEATTGDGPGTVTEATFTYTGDVNPLLDELAAYDLLDLDLEEAPLEEVFMRFYGGDDDA